jgi:hypothetical protein
MIYMITAIGLPPGGSITVYIYTQTIHRTTQNKQYIEQHKKFGRVRAVPRLCEQDALFLNLILVKNFTYFRQIYCPSSGVVILYSQQ